MIRFDIPPCKKKRVLLISDVKNEVDDPFAIVHALLTESLDVRGVIPAHFSWKKPKSQQDSARELKNLLALMGMTEGVKTADGAQGRLEEISGQPLPPGVELMLTEADRQQDDMLYIVCLGPLTDLALALRQRPSLVQQRVTAVWIGGLLDERGEAEPNLRSDVQAAREVFASGIPLWQIPREAYSMLPVSFAELYTRVRPWGAVGRYLADSVIAFNNGGARKPAEHRVLGDSPAIGVLINEDCGRWREKPTPMIQADMRYVPGDGGHTMRIYETMDSRFILEDFFAKLQLMGQGNAP